MSVVIDGTLGITTPAETVQGALTTTGNTILGDASTDTLNVGNGGLVKDASGNVGIGTASPSATLHVTNVNLTSPLLVGSQTDSLSWGGFFVNGATSSTGGNGIYGKTGASLYYSVATGLNHIWTTNSAEKMRIDSSGNLLVRTTNSNITGRGPASIVASGSAQDTVNLAQSSNSTFNIASLVTTTSGTRYHMGFGDGTTWTERGTISTNGSTTTYSTSSDYRLKEKIAPMIGALDVVAQLKPCTYTWKESGVDGQGFIAHELQEVVEGCVTGEKDAVDEKGNPKYQGIDTSFLVATLTAAIQELKAIVDAQAVRIAALES